MQLCGGPHNWTAVQRAPEIVTDVFRAPRRQKPGRFQSALSASRKAKRRGSSRKVELLQMVQPPLFQAFDRARQHREPLADLERRLNDVRDDIAPVRQPGSL